METTQVNYSNMKKVYFICLIIITLLCLLDFRLPYSGAIFIYSIISIFVCIFIKNRKIKSIQLSILFLPIALIFYMKKEYLLTGSLFISLNILTIYCVSKEISKYKKVKLIALILSIPIIFTSIYFINQNKIIKDSVLERKVKTALAMQGYLGKITLDNLSKLSSLYIHSENIYTLEGLQYAENLYSLCLDNCNEIKDLELIKSIPNLDRLNLENMDLDKLNGLEGLENLGSLDIFYPKSGNIPTLKNFPSLKILEIGGVELKDVSIVENLTSLNCLYFYRCKIEDLKGLEKLKNLKELRFYRCDIKNIDYLDKLTWIEEIDIDGKTK